MVSKILIVGVLLLLLVLGYFTITNLNNSNKQNKEKVYQGAVPEGYDLEHFRRTGETKPLNETGGSG